MLWQRILTTFVGLPGLLYVLLYGSKIMLGSCFVVFIGLSVFEMASMILPRFGRLFVSESGGQIHARSIELKSGPLRFFEFILCLVLGWLCFAAYLLLNQPYVAGALVCVLLASILIGVMLAKDINTAMGHATGYAMCIVYGVLPWFLIWDLSLMAPNSRFLILLLAIVWSGDTGAYFGGRFLGRHKLAPGFSPKKTWEGAVAGIFASIVGGYLANMIWSYSMGSNAEILFISVIGGSIGQMGDLVESAFKRFAEIKDSGNLIPGHGGFLDRCDGLLFAAPAVWILLNLFASYS